METKAHKMRRTHLTILVSNSRVNISTTSIAKAIQQEVGFAWEDIHISATFPNDFLVRFRESWQRDLVYERRTIQLRHGSMVFKTWSPTGRGRPQTWRYYCYVIIEGALLCAWDDGDTVKSILGGACELDHVERRSVLKVNTAGLLAWIWSLDPDYIARTKTHSMLGRLPAWHAGLPEGTPSEEGLDSTRYHIILHLDMVKDYRPVRESSNLQHRVEWPAVTRREWQWGEEDAITMPHDRPVRNRLGLSSHHKDEKDDQEGHRDGRAGGGEARHHGSRGSHHAGDAPRGAQ